MTRLLILVHKASSCDSAALQLLPIKLQAIFFKKNKLFELLYSHKAARSSRRYWAASVEEIKQKDEKHIPNIKLLAMAFIRRQPKTQIYFSNSSRFSQQLFSPSPSTLYCCAALSSRTA